MPERITVVGIAEERPVLHPQVQTALTGADLVAGGRRLLDAAGALVPLRRTLVIDRAIDAALDAIAAERGQVCVLASGDPGFFGILRPLSARFGPHLLDVHTAPSSVATAFARLGVPWDDAVVVSAHGRPLDVAAATAAAASKVAVLVSPEHSPEMLGRELLRAGAGDRRVSVCSRLGTSTERVVHTDLAGLAEGPWDPLSVVVLMAPTEPRRGASLAWGLAEGCFDHRAGMVTKAEVRSVALGKLDLPPAGVMWDVGAGCGSVAIEAARLAPELQVYAVERDADDARRARSNARAHGVAVHVVEGEAPGALAGLPDPGRAFVGGGGPAVLEEVLRRLAPGGRLVATFAALDRAADAARQLGNLVQITAARGEQLPDGGLRLAAQNPVFVVWGPGA